MDSTEWQEIKHIFLTANDMPEQKRADYLSGCDEHVRIKVEKLLKADKNAKNFIVEPAVIDTGLVEENEHDPFIDGNIDGYKIIREIGHGGMGTVYLARRSDESFDKTVALKLVKRGMDTNAVLKRFFVERSILAHLEHPNIAGLIDGGTTHDGLPYFVMEYVDGMPVTKYCDSRASSINERLELFQKVCAAVSYAHANLVVHRDVKPSNILVTHDGTPKLLDFGIAKLLHPDWSLDTAEATATMFRILTPEYASPEQIRGLPITTASDVYSLGIVLYELLCGERPFKIDSRLPDDAAQIVLTAEPVKPSSVVSHSNAERGVRNAELGTNKNAKKNTTDDEFGIPHSALRNPHSAIRNLKGDLDNIVLKAIRKEPERRYATVQEFSEDIRRHLAGLPVTATADTKIYRLTKFAKRHSAGVAAGCLIVLMLITATAITGWQAVAARRERDRAEQRFNQVRKLANTVLFDYHDGIAKLPGSTALRERMVKDALEYLDNLSQETGNNPELLKELSVAYRKVGDIQGDPYAASLGKSSEALESYQKALEIQERLLQMDQSDVDMQLQYGKTMFRIADCYLSRGNYGEALNSFRAAQLAYQTVSSSQPQDPLWKTTLARLYSRSSSLQFIQGEQSEASKDFQMAQKYNEEAIAMAPEDSSVLVSCAQIYSAIGNNLGNPDFNDLGKTDEALEILQKSLSIRRKVAEREPNNSAYKNELGVSLKDIGDIYLAQGNIIKAVENYEQSLMIHQAIADNDEKDALAQATVAYDLNKLGIAQLANGKKENALKRHEQSVAILEKIYLSDKENLMVTHTLALSLEGYANALKASKDFQKALQTYQRSLQIESQLNQSSKSTHIEIKIAQLYYRLGQVNQLIYSTKMLDNKACQDAKENYKKSVETFVGVQNVTYLSPTNTRILEQARQGFKCHFE
jgi:eukaryotic-like serine/threonine-protein kinase